MLPVGLESTTPCLVKRDSLPTRTPPCTRAPQVQALYLAVLRLLGTPGELALRFDMTVPLARFIAKHMDEVGVPFKRFLAEQAEAGA